MRLDLVERLADAVLAQPQPEDAALARIIGRPARDLAGVMAALGYRRVEADGAVLWRLAQKRRRARQPAPGNAFAGLAALLPDGPGGEP